MTATHEPKVSIHINDQHLRLRAGGHSVAELKGAVDPPIPNEDVLWQDVNGGPDVQLGQDETIDLIDGLVLFSQGVDGAHPHRTPIIIDGLPVNATNESVTGAIIRGLVTPPIPADRDLFRDVDGAPDERIGDDEVVTLAKAAEFYSVPSLIAPGAA